MKVGAYVGRFLLDLIADGEVDLALVHVIGHSLGAQASGEMGRELQRILGPAGALPRISGLDPAKPWFESRPGNTLSPTDAQWVDVMHTNSGDLVNVCGKKFISTHLWQWLFVHRAAYLLWSLSAMSIFIRTEAPIKWDVNPRIVPAVAQMETSKTCLVRTDRMSVI